MEETQALEAEWLTAYKKDYGEYDPNKSMTDILPYRKGWEAACGRIRQPPDSWRGPEERPDEGARIVAWVKSSIEEPEEIMGYYLGIEDLFLNERDFPESWSNIICWHPIDFGPMPERFKTVKEGER